MAHNRRGSHDEARGARSTARSLPWASRPLAVADRQVMAMLESRSEPGWEDRLLAQWRQ